jgi:hypothetical protein
MNNRTRNWGWAYAYMDAPLIQDVLRYKESPPVPNTALNFTISNQLSFYSSTLISTQGKTQSKV